MTATSIGEHRVELAREATVMVLYVAVVEIGEFTALFGVTALVLGVLIALIKAKFAAH